MYGPAGILNLWLQLDSGEGREKCRKVVAGAEGRKTEAIILNQRQSKLLKKTVRQRERCSVVDRDREGVGGGTKERQVFELAANPQILEDF